LANLHLTGKTEIISHIPQIQKSKSLKNYASYSRSNYQQEEEQGLEPRFLNQTAEITATARGTYYARRRCQPLAPSGI
jgi:hypothetical protein